MTEKQRQKAVDVLINTAMINATSEQCEMVIDTYQFKVKQEFKQWLKLTDKLLNSFKKQFSESEVEMVDNMTDVYHSQSESIREQLKETK